MNRLPAALLLLASAPAAARNVLVVIADDLGEDKVGVYADTFAGYRDAAAYLPATPTLDGLAAHGLTFTRAWADPVCSPTRFTIQSGQHAFRGEVGQPLGPWQPGPPWADYTTLAGVMTRTGYATALFGKWHVGTEGSAGTTDWSARGTYVDEVPNPVTAGYQSFLGFLNSDLASYNIFDQVRHPVGLPVTFVEQRVEYATQAQTEDALAWIDAQSGPWFATLALSAPHRSGGGDYRYDDVDDSCVHTPALKECVEGVAECDEIRASYAGLVECLDSALGDVLTGMDADTLAETDIYVVGDNGTPRAAAEWRFWDPDEDGAENTDRGKGFPYQAGVRVPLIVTDGGELTGDGGRIVSPGRTVDLGVQAMDIYATVIRSATGNRIPTADARDFNDCFRSTDPLCGRGRPPMLYAESWYADGAPSGTPDFGATLGIGDHTLVITPGVDARGLECRSAAVYDLATDYWQLTPLTNPRLLGRMRAHVDALAPTWMMAYPWC